MWALSPLNEMVACSFCVCVWGGVSLEVTSLAWAQLRVVGDENERDCFPSTEALETLSLCTQGDCGKSEGGGAQGLYGKGRSVSQRSWQEPQEEFSLLYEGQEGDRSASSGVRGKTGVLGWRSPYGASFGSSY